MSMTKSKTSFIVPFLLYALMVGTTFSPEVQPVLAKAFGLRPFGHPVAIVVAAAVAILMLPFAVAVHHFMLIAERAASDGRGLGRIGLLAYAVRAGRYHPDLRASQWISLAGLVYFVLICAGWIVFADARGI